eukprot:1317244-Rhodomonas_salina.1
MRTRSGRAYCLSACITIKGGRVKAKFHRPHDSMMPCQKLQPMVDPPLPVTSQDTASAAAATAKRGGHFKPVYTTAHTNDGPILEPRNVSEAMALPQAARWLESIQAEVQGLAHKGPFIQAYLPKGATVIPTRLVFKVKTDENCDIKKYKCRLVVKGFHQCHGVDYNESFAPVAHATTIRVALAIATSKDWDITHVDVTQSFLNSEMGEKEVYVEPPDCIPEEWGFDTQT